MTAVLSAKRVSNHGCELRRLGSNGVRPRAGRAGVVLGPAVLSLVGIAGVIGCTHRQLPHPSLSRPRAAKAILPPTGRSGNLVSHWRIISCPAQLRPHPAGGGSAAKGQLYTFHGDRKSTRLNSSHPSISYAVFC